MGRGFFPPPKENVRPAAFKNPPEEDLGIGGTGTSPESADDGAVEELLWREELSVEVALVVLEDALPLSGG